MESPSLIDMRLECEDDEQVLQAMNILIGYKKSFYYLPLKKALRVLIRNRARLNSIHREAKELGIKVKRYYS